MPEAQPKQAQDEKATVVDEPLASASVATKNVNKRFSLQAYRLSRSGEKSESRKNEDIAIIGLSGRYPQANSLDTYWENLLQGRDCITEIPPSRWDYKRYFNADREAKDSTYSKWGGFLDNIDQFDAQFFNISRRWAEIIDPQARQFLQTAWQCIEDAAYTRKSLSDKSVGVFAGVMWGHYDQLKASEEQKQYGRPWVSFASVANRVSYFLDFHGPSMTMDTMCSSSLTAIHQACLSIRNGDCDVALAGGVNLQTAPVKYLALSKAQFMSTDGRCRSFGEGGDGYVPGEGIGAALLKPLSEAIKDGDHIHGVIKGMALNHGGRTNGYTVPNQTAQTNVIGKALDRANWDPASIDYIEAHGTGTSLGDPIEIAGITKAFAQRTSKESGNGAAQYCRIGSVKSNVGHLESAAGIAALSKVLLQMKHKTIAPSLHSSSLNPNINFEQTPFKVVQQAEPWESKLDVNGKCLPRRAGISSFGAGGSNAHLLVEEYIPAKQSAVLWAKPDQNSRPVPGIFVLSADTQERLSMYVDSMLRFLKKRAATSTTASEAEAWFSNFVYTSQIGRELMAERLAVVAYNLDELVTALQTYGTDKKSNKLYLGSLANQSDKFETIIDNDTKDALIESMLSKQQFSQLARAWASYLGIDWAQHTRELFPNISKQSLQRMPIPTMPFITQRYWIDEANDESTTVQSLHPLIDSNESTLSEQRYLKNFTGKEFYLQDHVVGVDDKQVILPGVAYMEMARAMASLAMSEDFRVHRLCNLMWIQAIEIENKPRDIYLRLDQQQDSVSFDVVSKQDSSLSTLTDNCVSHCQGEVYYLPASIEMHDEYLDIEALKSQAIAVEHQEQIYQEFEQMGFCYGPSFQVTDTRYRMQDAALCKLVLPQHLVSDFESYYIHPSLMDAALRTCLGIGEPGHINSVPIVPFALQEMEIRAPLTRECYAYALPADGEQSALKKFDLVITDNEGKVLIKLHNFAGRELIKSNDREGQINYFDYHWQQTPLTENTDLSSSDTVLVIGSDAQRNELLAEKVDAKVISVEFGECFAQLGETSFKISPDNKDDYVALIQQLNDKAQWPGHIIHYSQVDSEDELYSDADDSLSSDRLKVSLDQGVHSIVKLFQALEQVKAEQPVRCVFAYRGSDSAHYPQYDGLSGLAKSLLVSNHRFELMTLCVDNTASEYEFVNYLLEELTNSEQVNGNEIKYQQGQRQKRQLTDFYPQTHQVLPIKEKGTYLISGGAGKLGLLFARYFAKTYQANLILLGRSALSVDQQQVIDELISMGSEVVYHEIDVTDLVAVNDLIENAKQQFGGLDGIIHSAGVVDVTPITQLSKAEFKNTLAPKLDGMLNLDIACKKEALDFFVSFSSVSALLGDLGAGSYAFANRFMDSFALIRNQWRAQGKRHGATISINWPLWAAGGMEIPDEEIALFNFSGISGLTEEEGLLAFETALSADRSQLVLATGKLEKIRRTFKVRVEQSAEGSSGFSKTFVQTSIPMLSKLERSEAKLNVQALKANPPLSNGLLQSAIEIITDHLSEIIKTDKSVINVNASFESLGMESVMLMEMQNSLKKKFEKLPKTALFEYDSVSRLAKYLVANDKETLNQLVGNDAESNDELFASVQTESQSSVSEQLAQNSQTNTAEYSLPMAKMRPSAGCSETPVEERQRDEDIAIIGISGRFPQASNLDEFWTNIQGGSNCITIVPQNRWDADKYYSNEPRLRSNQTCSKWGGFIDGVEQFDAEFFRMSQNEADRSDPQLRVLLETAWQALEDSAYTPDVLNNNIVGIYMGAMNDDFTWISSEVYARTNEYIGPGMVASELANRLSYAFDFKGPSVTIQTACSSSLTAIHMARMAILGGECDMAMAGGVNLSLHHTKYLLLQEMKVLSPDGQERTFDDKASGLVPSEGAGVVVMKRLSKALEDGDHIYGVIKGSVISHSGVGAGQYLPNIKVMEETALKSIDQANIHAEDMNYIECHGTGTELGDPIELKALSNAVSKHTNKKAYCALGSKANLGHMEAASGICSLIKVLLGMKHKRLSPCANLTTVNSAIELEDTPFYLPKTAEVWETNSHKKHVAGINAFGLGGSTGFIVVESMAENKPASRSQNQQEKSVVICSAKDQRQAKTYLKNMVEFIKHDEYESMSDSEFANFAYTTQLGRVSYNHRIAIVADGRDDFIIKAEEHLSSNVNDTAKGASAYAVFIGDINNGGDTLNLLSGEEGNSFIHTLVKSKKWKKIALLWVKGAVIDWTLLHQGYTRRRMSLPTYPFAKKECHINAYLKRRGIDEGKEQTSILPASACPCTETTQKSKVKNVIKGEWYKANTKSLDFDALIYGNSKSRTKRVRNANLKKYWINYLGDEMNKATLLLGENQQAAEASKNTSTVETTLNFRLPEQLNEALQEFTQRQEVEIETLMIGVWAVLISRYTKLKHAQFGVIKSLSEADNETVYVTEARARKANNNHRYALPLKVKTAVRGSISNWLGELQTKMDEKNVFGQIALKMIGKWTGVEELFDSVMIFTEAQTGEDRKLASDTALVHFSVPLTLHVHVNASALELTICYKHPCFEEDKIKTMINHFIVLLEGLIQHPQRNPSALSLQTKQEYRERFWKTLETNLD